MITIRNAAKADIESLVALCAETLPEKWSAESFSAEFEKNSVVLCAADDGEIIGFAVTAVSFDEGYLDLIAVSEKYRRQGIARRLLNATEHELIIRGATHAVLDVRESNDAVKFYKACGYKVLCTRRDFYSNPRENAFTMTKELGENK